MTTATKTKGELAREGRASNALAKIKAEADNIAKLEKQIDASKTKIGKLGMTARKNGVALKDISAVTGYSIGWVQQALVAAGYVPRAYNTNGDAAAK
jgi:hypothetical protein